LIKGNKILHVDTLKSEKKYLALIKSLETSNYKFIPTSDRKIGRRQTQNLIKGIRKFKAVTAR